MEDLVGPGLYLLIGDLNAVVGEGTPLENDPLDLKPEKLGELVLANRGILAADEPFYLANGYVNTVDGGSNGTSAGAGGERDRDQKRERHQFLQARVLSREKGKEAMVDGAGDY